MTSRHLGRGRRLCAVVAIAAALLCILLYAVASASEPRAGASAQGGVSTPTPAPAAPPAATLALGTANLKVVSIPPTGEVPTLSVDVPADRTEAAFVFLISNTATATQAFTPTAVLLGPGNRWLSGASFSFSDFLQGGAATSWTLEPEQTRAISMTVRDLYAPGQYTGTLFGLPRADAQPLAGLKVNRAAAAAALTLTVPSADNDRIERVFTGTIASFDLLLMEAQGRTGIDDLTLSAQPLRPEDGRGDPAKLTCTGGGSTPDCLGGAGLQIPPGGLNLTLGATLPQPKAYSGALVLRYKGAQKTITLRLVGNEILLTLLGMGPDRTYTPPAVSAAHAVLPLYVRRVDNQPLDNKIALSLGPVERADGTSGPLGEGKLVLTKDDETLAAGTARWDLDVTLPQTATYRTHLFVSYDGRPQPLITLALTRRSADPNLALDIPPMLQAERLLLLVPVRARMNFSLRETLGQQVTLASPIVRLRPTSGTLSSAPLITSFHVRNNDMTTGDAFTALQGDKTKPGQNGLVLAAYQPVNIEADLLHFGGPGAYRGELTFVTNDGTRQTAGFTLNVRDFAVWAILAIALGVLGSWWLQTYSSTGRNRLLIKERLAAILRDLQSITQGYPNRPDDQVWDKLEDQVREALTARWDKVEDAEPVIQAIRRRKQTYGRALGVYAGIAAAIAGLPEGTDDEKARVLRLRQHLEAAMIGLGNALVAWQGEHDLPDGGATPPADPPAANVVKCLEALDAVLDKVRRGAIADQAEKLYGAVAALRDQLSALGASTADMADLDAVDRELQSLKTVEGEESTDFDYGGAQVKLQKARAAYVDAWRKLLSNRVNRLTAEVRQRGLDPDAAAHVQGPLDEAGAALKNEPGPAGAARAQAAYLAALFALLDAQLDASLAASQELDAARRVLVGGTAPSETAAEVAQAVAGARSALAAADRTGNQADAVAGYEAAQAAAGQVQAALLRQKFDLTEQLLATQYPFQGATPQNKKPEWDALAGKLAGVDPPKAGAKPEDAQMLDARRQLAAIQLQALKLIDEFIRTSDQPGQFENPAAVLQQRGEIHEFLERTPAALARPSETIAEPELWQAERGLDAALVAAIKLMEAWSTARSVAEESVFAPNGTAEEPPPSASFAALFGSPGAPVAAPLPPEAQSAPNARRSADRTSNEATIPDYTAMIDRADRWRIAIVLALAVAIGFKLLWIDNLTWGSPTDYLVALLWGFGFSQIASGLTFTRVVGQVGGLPGLPGESQGRVP